MRRYGLLKREAKKRGPYKPDGFAKACRSGRAYFGWLWREGRKKGKLDHKRRMQFDGPYPPPWTWQHEHPAPLPWPAPKTEGE